MTTKLTHTDIQDMAYHWLNTPVCGYLGSDYGSDPKALLQQPNEAGLADGFIHKLIVDVPVLEVGSVDIFSLPVDSDGFAIALTLNGQPLAALNQQARTNDAGTLV